jgi:hypothetical protein
MPINCVDLSGYRRKESPVKSKKPDNKPMTSIFSRYFSGAKIACKSAMELELHPAGLEAAPL